MSIRKSPRGQWVIDVKIRMPDGSITRIRKVCPVQTKQGRGAGASFAKFAEFFIDTYATTNNRPSTVR